MSQQELLLYHVSALMKHESFADKTDQEIIDFLSDRRVPKKKVIEALNIYRYKPPNDTIPSQWIEEFLFFVDSYSKSENRNPDDIAKKYFNHVLSYLSGSDLVSISIALSQKGHVIEDFCYQYIKHHPVLDVELDIDHLDDNSFYFPAYQERKVHNYKFLYHLLYAYPDVHILGGAYGRKVQTCLESKTCIALYHHRKYLCEKALRGGGIALCLNVFNRIILNPKYRVVETTLFDMYSPGVLSSSWKYLHRQIDMRSFSEYMFYMFSYFGPGYAQHHSWKYDEMLQDVYDIDWNELLVDGDDVDDDRLFRAYFSSVEYKGMTQLVNILRPLLSEYPWDEHLAQHLAQTASDRDGPLQCVKLLMEQGAKLNLDGRIKNDRTGDIITECLWSTPRIAMLVAIFEMIDEKGDQFKNEDAKISSTQMEAILEHANFEESRKLKSILSHKRYLVTQSAHNVLRSW